MKETLSVGVGPDEKNQVDHTNTIAKASKAVQWLHCSKLKQTDFDFILLNAMHYNLPGTRDDCWPLQTLNWIHRLKQFRNLSFLIQRQQREYKPPMWDTNAKSYVETLSVWEVRETDLVSPLACQVSFPSQFQGFNNSAFILDESANKVSSKHPRIWCNFNITCDLGWSCSVSARWVFDDEGKSTESWIWNYRFNFNTQIVLCV